MTGAYIRGTGLSCALGLDTDSCVSALLRGQQRPETLELDGFAETLRMPYYRIRDRADLFDAGRFENLLPAVVHAAVAQAGLTAVEIRALPLFIGSSCFSIGQSETRYANALERQAQNAIPMPSCGYQDIAAILQDALGCAGETYTWNTACTASANALLAAQRMIELGWHQHTLVVGAELANRTTLAGFAGLQLLADAVKPFDAARKGIVLGEGIGAVLLSAQPHSADNLRILGGANNCDTWSVTAANPNGESVTTVLCEALKQSRLQPTQVRGIKAHGTATPVGDAAEAQGLRQVFETSPPLSALKPYLGHTLGACGINELVLFAGTLRHGYLPATPGFDTPDPALDVRPLGRSEPAAAGHYLLNYFGFGGNNTVLVLEKPSP